MCEMYKCAKMRWQLLQNINKRNRQLAVTYGTGRRTFRLSPAPLGRVFSCQNTLAPRPTWCQWSGIRKRRGQTETDTQAFVQYLLFFSLSLSLYLSHRHLDGQTIAKSCIVSCLQPVCAHQTISWRRDGSARTQRKLIVDMMWEKKKKKACGNPAVSTRLHLSWKPYTAENRCTLKKKKYY